MPSRGVMEESSAESVEAKEWDPMAVDHDHDHDDIFFNKHIWANGNRVTEVGHAEEVLTRVELDLAYCSEKVLNLDILLMRVASRLSDSEALDMEHSLISSDATNKAFEFDTLSGILDSEIKELDNYMTYLQTEIVGVRQMVQPSGLFKVSEVEKRLQDAEGSLKQTQEQVDEIKIQSTKFEKTLAIRRKEIWNSEADGFLESGQSSTNSEWRMQTVEQQRHILQMLQKSLAREIDLERELSDSKNNVATQSKLHLLEWDNCCIQEPTETIQENLFRVENVVEVLMEVSNELVSKPETVQFNSDGSIQWENEMRCKLQESMLKLSAEGLGIFLVQQANSFRDSIKDAKDKYISAISETLMLEEKVKSLEDKLRESGKQLQQAKDAIEASECQQEILQSQLTEMAHVIGDLQENTVKAEIRAESAEAMSTLLSKTNLELSELCCFMRSNLEEKENLLESKLKESNAQMEHANMIAKANEEEQNLLFAAISDRDILIEDLKEKVSKAEIRAESAESRCSLLTESNFELNEELNFLRSRVACLKRSVQQTDEMKAPDVKDIGIRSNIITYIVLKLVLERKHLLEETCGLERNQTSQCRQRKNEACSLVDSKDEEEISSLEAFKEPVMWTSATKFQVENSDAHIDRTNSDATSSSDGETSSATKPNSAASKEIRQLNSKHVFISSIVMVLSVCGMYIFQLRCSLK